MSDESIGLILAAISGFIVGVALLGIIAPCIHF